MKSSKNLIFILLFPLMWGNSSAPAPRPDGKDYALFIAIEQYDNTVAWKKLPGLIAEVEAIASDLRDLYGYSETKVLKNPSLAEIDAELAAWRARSFGPHDQLFVYISGHGQYVDDRKQGYFIPRDGTGSTGSIYERKWLPYLDLRRLVTGIGCRHILLALDACYSGTADDQIVFKDENEEWATPSKAAEQQYNQQIKDQLRCQSRILLTSGGKTKTENPSKFAASFRKAFSKQGGADRIVRPSDIMEEWHGLSIPPHATTFEGHEGCGNFLFLYQPKSGAATETKVSPPDMQNAASQDYDSDGVPDKDDACPTENGPATTKGCPDADGDGVADKFDNCKDEKGTASNNGCPESTPAEKAAEKSAFEDLMAATMVEVVGGKFKMGSDNGESDERPIHEVELSTFYLSRYEVTIGQYLAFCEATNSHWPEWLEKGNQYHIETGKDSYYRERGMSRKNKNYPITGVSWEDAVAYCTWLSERSGKSYRLPTEAEWEYAARGGNKSQGYTYAGSNDLKQVGWYWVNSGEKLLTGEWTSDKLNLNNCRTHRVGQKKANELGLYDMSGNVWEWCSDWYDANFYKTRPSINPKGPSTGDRRVCRGGAWGSFISDCQLTDRRFYDPPHRSGSHGFRVAKDVLVNIKL